MALFPDTKLSACTTCDELIRVTDPSCPHCGAARARADRGAAMFALAAAIAVTGCSEPDYGVPATDTLTTDATGTDATGTDASGTDATSTDATSTDATSTDATGTSSTPTTGPGETSTGSTGTGGSETAATFEPDYGVPATTGE